MESQELAMFGVSASHDLWKALGYDHAAHAGGWAFGREAAVTGLVARAIDALGARDPLRYGGNEVLRRALALDAQDRAAAELPAALRALAQAVATVRLRVDVPDVARALDGIASAITSPSALLNRK